MLRVGERLPDSLRRLYSLSVLPDASLPTAGTVPRDENDTCPTVMRPTDSEMTDTPPISL
jgi:hypothetical protein